MNNEEKERKRKNFNIAEGVFLIVTGIFFIWIFIKVTLGTPNAYYFLPIIIPMSIPSIGAIVFGWKLIFRAKQEEEKQKKRTKRIISKYREFVYAGDSDHPYYYIITSWVNPDDHKLYYFSSNNVPYETEKLIETTKITNFPVDYEPGNIKNYKIDFSNIIKEAEKMLEEVKK